MKKLILVSTAVLLWVGSFAQTDNKMNHDMNNNVKHRTMDKSHKDCVMMKDGKMMMMKNGKTMVMEKNMTMSNGTQCMTDGTCIKKDGKKMMMKDGQCMDMSGKMTMMKKDHMKNEKMTK